MTLVRGTSHKSLGEMLVEARLITDEQWQQTLGLCQTTGHKSEQVLVEQKLVTPQQVAFFTSLLADVPFVNLKRQRIDPDALALIPEATARKYIAIPLQVRDGTLVMAMSDPRNIEVIRDLEALVQKKIEPVLSLAQDIQGAIDNNYRASAEIEKQLSQIPTQSRRGLVEARVSAEAVAQAPVVRALDLLITQAVRDRASDVHLEPQEDKLRVRYRIDGILHEVMSLPLSVYPPLISRVKIMAGMNIAERRRSQDGQISFKAAGKDIDIRAATSNTVYGEMAVLRLLDKTFVFRSLSQLGFLKATLDVYKDMLRTPFGMILASGPTGSGKTTTLYGSVNQIDSIGRNIITIEDPVEYRFKNINQMQVNVAAGVTFAAGLRATMRLDPNVILVGEIRDSETARIAIQAALTGHLVLSSVHANDTAGSVFRLMDLGIEPFLLASGLIGVLAQRMVRRVCPHCARLVPVTSEEKLAYQREMGEETSEFLMGGGCNFCANTGYLGRTGIYEIMAVSEPIRRLILTNASGDEIRNQALKEGMITLWRDGMTKVKMGITTPSEVIRNVFSVA